MRGAAGGVGRETHKREDWTALRYRTGEATGPKKGPLVGARGQWFYRQNIGAEPSGGDVTLTIFLMVEI
jgi:hypothetical protein